MPKDKKARIGVIGLKGLPAFGGAAAVGENIIAQLGTEFNFTIYSVSSHTHLKSGNYKNSFQIVLRKLPFKRLNSFLYYLRAAIHALLFGKYDLIHLHHRDASFIIPILKLRFPIVVTTHGMILTTKWMRYKFFFDFEDRYFLHRANYITTVSLKDQRIVSSLVDHERVKYIPNGVNENHLGESSKKNYISFAAGRMLPDKGCHTFLEALGMLTSREKAILIGDLDQNEEYKKKLLELQQKVGGIRFTGLIKKKEKLFEMIGRSKFFVFPSEIESMSMMLLEVAALKVPIICSDIPENRDIFTDEEVLYFNVKDAVDLSKKIEYAVSNPMRMHQLAEKAYARLQNDYLWTQIAGEYKQVFEQLIH